jgi:hypothetical protein
MTAWPAENDDQQFCSDAVMPDLSLLLLFVLQKEPQLLAVLNEVRQGLFLQQLCQTFLLLLLLLFCRASRSC